MRTRRAAIRRLGEQVIPMMHDICTRPDAVNVS